MDGPNRRPSLAIFSPILPVMQLPPCIRFSVAVASLVMAELALLSADRAQAAPAPEPSSESAQSLLLRALPKAERGDYAGVIADTTRVLELDPANAAAYRERGRARYNRNDFAGAIADANLALKFNPKYPEAYALRAAAKEGQHDYDGGIAALKHSSHPSRRSR